MTESCSRSQGCGTDPQKSVELFRVLREANLSLLKSLQPEQWKHYGMHSERGQESIEKTVHMFAGHDINHLQQIDDIVAHQCPRRGSTLRNSFVIGIYSRFNIGIELALSVLSEAAAT
jgi:hypothetical protein